MTCPNEVVSVELDAHAGSITAGPDGVTIEALQIPDYPAPDYTRPAPQSNSDPAAWDRSELPAGACVFRLHGLNAACFPTGGEIFIYPPNSTTVDAGQPEVHPLVLTSFYDFGHCGEGPGCPSADTRDPLTAWWYLADRGDAADLVICAQDCALDVEPYSPAMAFLNPLRKCPE